jgi:hypothetical protein
VEARALGLTPAAGSTVTVGAEYRESATAVDCATSLLSAGTRPTSRCSIRSLRACIAPLVGGACASSSDEASSSAAAARRRCVSRCSRSDKEAAGAANSSSESMSSAHRVSEHTVSAGATHAWRPMTAMAGGQRAHKRISDRLVKVKRNWRQRQQTPPLMIMHLAGCGDELAC